MKNREFQKHTYFLAIISITVLLFGVYLSYVGGYGSDEDTLPLIGAFESMMGGKNLMASRFTPYPVAEIGIGFLSYNFGSFASNLFTFLFFVFGIIFFYIGVNKKFDNKTFFLFFVLCISNPVLFFDNLEPIDYSWAFMPFALGTFFLKKNHFELAVVFFGIAIGTRIYFLIFIFVAIYLFHYSKNISNYKKTYIFISSFFIGGLFYLPIWFENGFGLGWLTAVTPNNQGFEGLSARFFYKIMMSFTFLNFIALMFFIFTIKKFKIFFSSNLLVGIIILNLVLFFFIPAELSYLQPLLISFYLICSKNFKVKILYIIIFLQFSSWFYEIQPLKIYYKSENKCDNVEAIDAEIKLSIIEGRYLSFINTRQKISCWINDKNTERSKKILEGKALK